MQYRILALTAMVLLSVAAPAFPLTAYMNPNQTPASNVSGGTTSSDVQTVMSTGTAFSVGFTDVTYTATEIVMSVQYVTTYNFGQLSAGNYDLFATELGYFTSNDNFAVLYTYSNVTTAYSYTAYTYSGFVGSSEVATVTASAPSALTGFYGVNLYQQSYSTNIQEFNLPSTEYIYVVQVTTITFEIAVLGDTVTWDLPNGSGIDPVTVPEPATVTLLAIGAFSLVGYSWRRRERFASA